MTANVNSQFLHNSNGLRRTTLGFVPALSTSKNSPASCLKNPSAIRLLAELPIQRMSTRFLAVGFSGIMVQQLDPRAVTRFRGANKGTPEPGELPRRHQRHGVHRVVRKGTFSISPFTHISKYALQS